MPDSQDDCSLNPCSHLTLIRHAETTANINRVLQGVTDSPLTVYGQSQVEALAKVFNVPSKCDRDVQVGLGSPILIVSSPIGRARKTAEAIYKACGGRNDAILLEKVTQASYHSQPTWTSLFTNKHGNPTSLPVQLVLDFGLAERDFGGLESTRSGLHVPGFPKSHGRGESKSAFQARVEQVGREWLQSTQTWVNGGESSVVSNDMELEASRSDVKVVKTSPIHVVLVTHGLWISCFLSHPPSNTSEPLPFAANTGIFTVQVHPPPNDTENRLRTTLVKANEVVHLANVKRQTGGIGSSAHDAKQTTLYAFFTPTLLKTEPNR